MNSNILIWIKKKTSHGKSHVKMHFFWVSGFSWN